MALIFISFLGGVLTILSPCVLPLLPVIIGGSVTNDHKWRPVIIAVALSVSVVIFTLALKFSTAFISVPPRTWSILSGGLVVVLGVVTLFPHLWEWISTKLRLSDRSNSMLSKSSQRPGWVGAVLVGLALGPVFSSCSPTYALILATVLPQSFLTGFINLIAYAVGLSLVLLLIAIFGQRLVKKLRWAANPEGWFRRAMGLLFVVVGVLILLGVDKDIETDLVERGFGITKLEERLVTDVSLDMDDSANDNSNSTDSTMNTTNPDAPAMNVAQPYQAPELTGIVSWINSEPLTLEELRGKVVLIDFWTYSCINCIRTLPFLRDWHAQYEDDGLVIIGVHAPEFAFEQERANVMASAEEYALTYPIALDNNFATWRAYSNRFWPAKYFIDRDGNVRHTHFGEGEYEESEEIIRYLLSEGGSQITDDMVTTEEVTAELTAEATSEATTPPISTAQTPETYLGYARAANFANRAEFVADLSVAYTTQNINSDEWTLQGDWTMESERIVSESGTANLQMQFTAKSVYIVIGTDLSDEELATQPIYVRVKLNGETISADDAGADVTDGVLRVDGDRLYTVVDFDSVHAGDVLELEADAGVQLHAFTFGS